MPLPEAPVIMETEEFGRALLLADTHVGYEFELVIKGVRVPRQTSRIIEHILNLAEREHVNSIIILGDVKHEIPVAIETAKEVINFLKNLASHVESLVLIQGNHDGKIDKLVEKTECKNIRVIESRGILVHLTTGKCALLLHGNAKPRPRDFAEADILVMGHTHPAVSLRDALGYVAREAVIVRAQVPKIDIVNRMYRKEEVKDLVIRPEDNITIVILPCANPLITGTDITRTLLQQHPTSRTILTYFQLWKHVDKIEVYLHDFTYLGTLDMLLELEKIVATREKVDWDLL